MSTVHHPDSGTTSGRRRGPEHPRRRSSQEDPQLRRTEAHGIRQERKLSTLLSRGCQPRRPSRSTKELVQQLLHDFEDVPGFSFNEAPWAVW
jgi:hypothetical protein